MAHPDDLTDVPTAAEYKEAFRAARDAGVLKSANGRSLVHDMLRANFEAPEHTVTAGELAAQVDLATFKQANLRYGTFAKDLCQRLGREPRLKIAVLVTFSGGKEGSKPEQDESIRWTLHPQVVQALKETWFAHLQKD